MRASHLQHGQRGLSLVELMVALLLGSVLIIGVTQLFLDQKRHAQFQFGQLANQGNARFATHAIEDEVEIADALFKTLSLVVNDLSGAEFADEINILGRCRRDDVRAAPMRQLNRKHANTARSAVNQNALTSL